MTETLKSMSKQKLKGIGIDVDQLQSSGVATDILLQEGATALQPHTLRRIGTSPERILLVCHLQDDCFC